MTDEYLLRVADVAKRLDVPVRWVYVHISEIPHVRLGRYIRFRPSDIADFIQQSSTNRTPEVTLLRPSRKAS